MNARDVMTSPAATVHPDYPLPEVVELMVTRGVSGVPVVDEGGALLGMITETDVVGATLWRTYRPRALAFLAEAFRGGGASLMGKSTALVAAQVMTANVHTCRLDDTVEQLGRRMRGHRVKRLPVVDQEGRVVGLVTRSDLLAAFGRPDDEVLADLDRLLQELCDGERVHASVNEGVVSLSGQVTCHSRRSLLARQAGRIVGVVAVVNRLSVRPAQQHCSPTS